MLPFPAPLQHETKKSEQRRRGLQYGSSRCCRLSGPLRRAGSFDAKALHAAVEIWTIGVQPSCCLGDVAGCDSQRRLDDAPFVIIKNFSESAVLSNGFFNCVRDNRSVAAVDAQDDRQRRRADVRSGMNDRGTLDDVCKLANVAR